MMALLLKFLPHVAVGLGVLSLVSSGAAYVEHLKLRAAQADLQVCEGQRHALQESVDTLSAEVDTQNAAIDALQATGNELQRRAAAAAGKVTAAQDEAQQHIAEIMAKKPPATEIEQCRAARLLLVQP